jgi:hypothetical protein
MGENGNGQRKGGLLALLNREEAGKEKLFDVPMLTPEGDYSGITLYFKQPDARTEKRYRELLNKNVGKNKSSSDEATAYVFKHKFDNAVFEEPSGTVEDELKALGCPQSQIDLYNTNPIQAFLTIPDLWLLMWTATNKYLNETTPEAGDSKK